MAGIRLKVEVKRNITQAMKREVSATAKEAIKNISQDFARTASESAPHKTGDLSASHSIAYSGGSDIPQGIIEFTAYKDGFNYALAMHEWTYNLGEGSRAKGGGTGMSGATYPVGSKFMTRVLRGEKPAYTEYLQKKIKSTIFRMGG